jgi:hypothetical protein
MIDRRVGGGNVGDEIAQNLTSSRGHTRPESGEPESLERQQQAGAGSCLSHAGGMDPDATGILRRRSTQAFAHAPAQIGPQQHHQAKYQAEKWCE